ncbi:MAG: acetyl-CoA carboxylase biotin carboxylase subunit [Ignavibacteria bacterium]|jgi:acetyl-CoA carboxylase biotin carboxylase subunit
MIKKILIANRGEIALRIIRTCKEMGIKTVAVYSEADKFADEAVCIGPPPAKDSYLNIPRLIAAAEITDSDAIHPGYGFLAENAEFAEICKDSNLIFIGPTAEMISMMGNKSSAKERMKQAGIPVIPGSDGIVKDYEEAVKICDKIGYPIMLKASAGGGGKGMRIVRDKLKLEELFTLAKSEALSAFGNDDMYIEKFIESPRHIEMPVLGDSFGRIITLSERDCTVQRRQQKLIEETPSPFINDEIRKQMSETAIKVAKSINYLNGGTVEFIMDKDFNFYFMEMNTRIQVEHTVSEIVNNHDSVKEQINIANGGKLSFKKTKCIGYAMECRINAEDVENNFRPSPGLLTTFHCPDGLGIRVDTHCYPGYTITSHYDSLIAKLIVLAESRVEAIRRMNRALEEFIIEGVKTTIPLFLQIMNDKNFIENNYDTTYLDKKLFNN